MIRRYHPRSGFTVTDLLMVIVIIGILAAIAIPKINHAGYSTRSAAQTVATTLLVAQRQAITEEHDVAVSFDAANRRLTILSDADNDGVTDATERVRHVTLEPVIAFGRGGATARAMGTSAVNFTRVVDGMPAVIFHRNGSASSAGGVYLTSKRATIDSKYSTDTWALEMVRATGRTEWFRFNGTTWIRGF